MSNVVSSGRYLFMTTDAEEAGSYLGAYISNELHLIGMTIMHQGKALSLFYIHA